MWWVWGHAPPLIALYSASDINCGLSSMNPLLSTALDVLYQQPAHPRCGYFCEAIL